MEDAEFRILDILYHHRGECIGVTDFRFPYSINPRTYKIGFVKALRNKRLRIEMRGLKKCHFITDEGIKYYNRCTESDAFLKKFLELYDAHTTEEKLNVLGQIFKDMLKPLLTENKPKEYRAVFDFLAMVIMDDLNKEWLDKKERMLKDNVFSGLYRFLGQSSEFTLPPYPLEFIVKDANLAWEYGDYLSTNHRYVLEKLNFHSKEDIEKKNAEYLEKHGGQLSYTVLREQLNKRVRDIKSMIEAGALYPKPSEPQDYPSGKIPLKTAPNWIRNIPEDYGEHLWDIR